MKTVVRELLDTIPCAEEIKQFIFENNPDEKMLDEWLFERIYKSKDWINLEKEQIENAYDDAKGCVCLQCDDMKCGGDYYNNTFNK